ncbi:ankyrin repeat-containing domain protein [Lactarius deliciosus]|nr:ankyrin repeat-containing domain protein [Lactarius deliciosus]
MSAPANVRIAITSLRIFVEAHTIVGEQFRGWLTPPDPSTNHTNACGTQHDCTAAWVFDDDIFKEWESSQSGSLLWIHGKAGSGKSILCSAIVQHLITLRDAGSASVAYFYFDFRDVDKKNCRNLVSSLLMQLSYRSRPCLDVLSRVYSTYNDGRERPSERSLVKCLKDMLMALSTPQLPTYIVLDALDECPNTSGIPTPRGHVLGLVADLVDLRLPNLHICATSRPETDISTALKPLTSGHFSLHDQPGQKRDISEYVNSVVQSDPLMKSWREDDRKLVVDTLSEKADGMFRWVFCQLEVLRHCLAPSLRRQLNELPRSLDETYERVLKEIESTNQGRHARRLLQCLAMAMRPLHVEELAEVLAFDFEDAKAKIPTFRAEWRWEDQEQAVLSACSSLISIVGGDSDDSRVVQFTHFSVKEYLTSHRLATASGDVSLYHIDPEPAHLILAQACLGVLLNSDDCGSSENRAKTIPLLKYSAEHWASHAQVGNVSSRLKDAMETLFDLNRPFFWAWKRVYDIFPDALGNSRLLPPNNPLYYAVLCGFYDQVQCLIGKYPDQVNHDGSLYPSPLAVALFGKHVRVADLLLEHGAHAHVRGNPPLCDAIQFSDDARVDAVRFLLRHGAHVNSGLKDLRTPLHLAALVGDPEVARILLEHGADVDIQDDYGQVPLHLVSLSERDFRSPRDKGGERSIIARLLVEHRADVNARDKNGATPLHFASRHWRFEICRLLLDNGANANARDTPLHLVSQNEYPSNEDPNIARLLLELGMDVNARDKDQATPLHFACYHGNFETALVLLNRGAEVNARDVDGQTPLHRISLGQNSRIAQLILERGADVNARDKDQTTPLHLACHVLCFETAQVLLNHGAKADARNADGQTPLHQVPQCQMVFTDDQHTSRFIRLLLEHGMGINALDNHQETPLHVACSEASLEIAQVLLDNGADVSAHNADGQTPLHRVSQCPDFTDYCHFELAQLLLERDLDVNARDKHEETPLHLAAYRSSFEIAEVLIEHGADANARNADGRTPLHRVVSQCFDLGPRHGNTSDDTLNVARLLLERGVDLNARDNQQATPLHLASYYGHVERLLERGADVNAQTKDHETPLHLALRLRLHEMARLLLKHGADVDVKNSEGKSPLQLACGRKGKAMRRLLSKYSSSKRDT